MLLKFRCSSQIGLLQDVTNNDGVYRSARPKRIGPATPTKSSGHKSTTCLQRGVIHKMARKESKCCNCGVGGHRRNTCSNLAIVLPVMQSKAEAGEANRLVH